MERLSRYLTNHGLSQAEFARRLGVSQPTVWRWLSGEYPKRTTMIAIERETGGAVPISAWFEQNDDGAAA